MGEVRPGSFYPVKVKFDSAELSPPRPEKVSESCSCVQAALAAITPNSFELSVRFQPKGGSGEDLEFCQVLDANSKPIGQLLIHARRRTPIEANPESVDFGSAPPGKREVAAVDITTTNGASPPDLASAEGDQLAIHVISRSAHSERIGMGIALNAVPGDVDTVLHFAGTDLGVPIRGHIEGGMQLAAGQIYEILYPDKPPHFSYLLEGGPSPVVRANATQGHSSPPIPDIARRADVYPSAEYVIATVRNNKGNHTLELEVSKRAHGVLVGWITIATSSGQPLLRVPYRIVVMS